MGQAQPKHPADWEGQASRPTEQPREHSPAEQAQPPKADAQDLYGPPVGQRPRAIRSPARWGAGTTIRPARIQPGVSGGRPLVSAGRRTASCSAELSGTRSERKHPGKTRRNLMAAIIDTALFLGFCYLVLYRIPKAIVAGIKAFRGK